MYKRKSSFANNSNAFVMHIICAAVFFIFTFSYLYFYQSEMLSLGQFIFSGGKTHYSPLIGGILITISLYIVHLLVYFVTRLELRFYALTYFPSLLFLSILTDVRPSIVNGGSLGHWVFTAPLLLIVYAIVVFFLRQYQQIENVSAKFSFVVNLLWINLLQMCIMFIFVGLTTASNDVFHYRMLMETMMLRGEYGKALRVGEKSLSADSSLTMLRAFCLSQEKKLGEHFFDYPVCGGSESLLPNKTGAVSLMFPSDSIKFLSKTRAYRGDYALMKLLLDKNLAMFVSELPKHYKINESLPRHYREAVVIYSTNTDSISLSIKDDAMLTDYNDFMKMRDAKKENISHIRDVYGKTYWYYYYFTRP